MADEERSKSEFNMAVSYLNRLNAILYTADEAAMDLDVYTWFHTLLTLYRELSTEMKPKEMEDFEAQIKELNPKIGLAMNERLKGNGDVDQDLYSKLHRFEIGLRKILKDSGLQNKNQDSALNSLR